jgi:hypothetical protein
MWALESPADHWKWGGKECGPHCIVRTLAGSELLLNGLVATDGRLPKIWLGLFELLPLFAMETVL